MSTKNRKLQVFVSSTFLDLREERQAAVEAILSTGNIPTGMELFVSGDQSQMEIIKEWIEESDIYLLILGGRYGTIEPLTGKSYVQMEYEYALEINKPVVSIVVSENVLAKKVKEYGSEMFEQAYAKEYSNFKELVLTRNLVHYYNDLKDLRLAIFESLSYLENDIFPNYDGEVGVKILQIPVELRTAFQQYLLFFKDYVRESKGKEIAYRVEQTREGLIIEINSNDSKEFADIVNYFDEYLGFARSKVIEKINIENNLTPFHIDILRHRLENQISNLQMEIKYRDLKINLLEEKVQRLDEDTNAIMSITSNISKSIKSLSAENFPIFLNEKKIQENVQLYNTCINLIENDEVDETFIILTKNLERFSENSKKSLTILKNQWKSLDKRYYRTEISFEVYMQHRSLLIQSIESLCRDLMKKN